MAAEGQAGRVLNVLDYGAVGDGETDCLAAVQAAAADLMPGDTLYFPAGRFVSSGNRPGVREHHVEITTPHVTITGPGTLVKFMFYLHGDVEETAELREAGAPALDDRLVSREPHGLKRGDFVQLLSQINCYATDAGEWQLGSRAPVSNQQFYVRFSEIQRVAEVPTPRVAVFNGKVLYPGYRGDLEGITEPIPGVDGAEFRRMNFLEGVTFRGLTFENNTVRSFRSIIARVCRRLLIESCHFEAAEQPGFHLRATDCLELRVRGCSSIRRTVGGKGASWNSFIVGGGCQDISFVGNRLTGEWQAIDFTGDLLPSDVGYTDQKTAWSTVQHMAVRNNKFFNCNNATTTHPGTAHFTFTGNEVVGGWTGVRVRSPYNLVANNAIDTERAGVALSSFVSHTTIRGNAMRHRPSTSKGGPWIGVHYVATGNETMTDNAPRRFVVSGNEFQCLDGSPQSAGIHLGHWKPKSEKFRLFTARVRLRWSDITLERNSFRGCSVVIGPWVNGARVNGNTFEAGTARSAYVEVGPNAAAATLLQNVFYDSLAPAMSGGRVSGAAYPYDPMHRLGQQVGIGPVEIQLENARGVTVFDPQEPTVGIEESGSE